MVSPTSTRPRGRAPEIARNVVDAAPDPQPVLQLDLDHVVRLQALERNRGAPGTRRLDPRRPLEDNGSGGQPAPEQCRLGRPIAGAVDRQRRHSPVSFHVLRSGLVVGLEERRARPSASRSRALHTPCSPARAGNRSTAPLALLTLAPLCRSASTNPPRALSDVGCGLGRRLDGGSLRSLAELADRSVRDPRSRQCRTAAWH